MTRGLTINENTSTITIKDKGGGGAGYEVKEVVYFDGDVEMTFEQTPWGGNAYRGEATGCAFPTGNLSGIKIFIDDTESTMNNIEKVSDEAISGTITIPTRSIIFNINKSGNIFFDSYETTPSFDGSHRIIVKDTIATVTDSFKKAVESVSKIKNLVDGSTKGSIRTTSSTSEDTNYKLGNNAFAEGAYTKASGQSSHAEGNGTTASGQNSHAEGGSTTASGDRAHAEGYGTTASSESSHAEGGSTTASGNYSHAEGKETQASGQYTHVEGYCTKASSDNQHVQGKYNVEDANGAYAFIIGNGTGEQKRSNAFAVKWDGTIVVWNNGTAVELTPANIVALKNLLSS